MTSLLKQTFFLFALSLACNSAQAQRLDWQRTQRMTLERQYAGPLTDTLIQRLRDPIDGSVCYLYIPISAAHSERNDSGYVQYGSNVIGSISCMPASPNPLTGALPQKRQ